MNKIMGKKAKNKPVKAKIRVGFSLDQLAEKVLGTIILKRFNVK